MAPLLKQIRLFSLFSLLLFAASISFAQTSRIEELLNQLNKNDPDTVQIKLLRRISAAYTSVDPLKKFYYAQQYLLLGQKNGIDSIVSTAYQDMGISYGIRSNLDSALYYFRMGYDIARKSNYTMGIARAHVNIGYAYDRLERKKESVKHYEEALKIYRRLNFRRGINQCITNLGAIYYDLNEYKVAEGYFTQVLENLKETPNDQLGLGGVFYSLGNVSWKLGNTKKAFNYYRQSLAIREKIGDINGIGLSNLGLGLLYNDSKNYKKAIQHLNIAVENNQKLKNVYQESVALRAIAESHLGLKDYKKAEEYASLALEKANESQSKALASNALKLLVDIAREQKNYQEALRLQSDYMLKRDSLNTPGARREVMANDLQRINTDNRNLEKHNKTISERNADYMMIIFIFSAMLVILAIVSILYYKRNIENKANNTLLQKQKLKIAETNEELTTQIEIVAAQNAELEKLNQIKNKFFSIVSHDLRSPMNSLKALFELFRDGNLDKEELNKLTIRIEDTIQTTATFLDNLLEWSKSQLDGISVNPGRVSMYHLVQENMKLMDAAIRAKSLTVLNRIAPDLQVFADQDMIDIVVRNLLSNAIKFCHPQHSIVFDATQAGDKVIWSVHDSGPGISKQDQENLFSLSRTTSTGTSGEKGYHIGLILCKDMILQNQGTIQVESELGKGTTFSITLPG